MTWASTGSSGTSRLNASSPPDRRAQWSTYTTRGRRSGAGPTASRYRAACRAAVVSQANCSANARQASGPGRRPRAGTGGGEAPAHGVGVTGLDEAGRVEAAEPLRQAADRRGDDRRAGGQGLEADEGEAFEGRGRDDADVGGAEQVGQLVVVQSTGEADPPSVRAPLERRALGPLARDHQQGVDARPGFDEGLEPHPWRQPPR